MVFEITCYMGLESITLSENEFPGLNDDTTIKELRNMLVKKGFFKQNEEYKFARKQVLNEHATNRENLLNLSLYAYADEADISIKRLYPESGKKRVQIANITNAPDLKKKPDYVGEYTTEWSKEVDVRDGEARLMKVKVELVEGNYQPIMLSNVIRTNNGADCYEYACICEEGSTLQFKMAGAGACGNVYRADILGGNQTLGEFGNISELNEGAYKFKWGCFNRWYGNSNYGKEIKIVSTDEMSGVDPQTKLQYRIINFQIKEITKWGEKDSNGNQIATYTVESYPPIPNGFKGPGKTLSAARTSDGNPILYNPVHVSDGTLGGGRDKGINWSSTRYYVSTKPYGVISAHFFIFKDMKTAEAYFKRYFG